MPYFKTNQGGDVAVNLALPTTGGAVLGIANYGASQLTATSNEVYALNPPVAGVLKTLIFHNYTTAAGPTVNLSTAQTVSLLGKTTGLSKIVHSAQKSTVTATVVQLMGINSTSWVLLNAFPNQGSVTTGSTGVATAITLTS